MTRDADPELPDASLQACEVALRQAQLASDVSVLDRLLDDALIFTGPDGALYGKQDDLDAHRSGAVRITRLEPSDQRIQRFAGITVVSVRMEMSGTFRGAAFAGPFRYTRVWCVRPEGWRIVTAPEIAPSPVLMRASRHPGGQTAGQRQPRRQ